MSARMSANTFSGDEGGVSGVKGFENSARVGMEERNAGMTTPSLLLFPAGLETLLAFSSRECMCISVRPLREAHTFVQERCKETTAARSPSRRWRRRRCGAFGTSAGDGALFGVTRVGVTEFFVFGVTQVARRNVLSYGCRSLDLIVPPPAP